jgi:hypothetical protein
MAKRRACARLAAPLSCSFPQLHFLVHAITRNDNTATMPAREGQLSKKLSYFYYEDEPGRRSAETLLVHS